MVVNIAEQSTPAKEQVKDDEYVKVIEQMNVLGEKLSPYEAELLQKADEVMGESGTAQTVYHAPHVEAAVGFGQELVDMLIEELEESEDSQALKKISSLVKILIKWHDAKLQPEGNLFSAEETSAAALIKAISNLGIELTPEESKELRGAIEATQVNPDQKKEKKLEQNYENDNLLQGIICAADLGHFALGDFKQFVELSLRFFVEINQLGQEDLDAWLEFFGLTDKAMKVLSQQIEYLNQYQFPKALPSKIQEELEKMKANKIETLQALVEGDEEESRTMSAMGKVSGGI
jgi:hypothetical protein